MKTAEVAEGAKDFSGEKLMMLKIRFLYPQLLEKRNTGLIKKRNVSIFLRALGTHSGQGKQPQRPWRRKLDD